MTDEQTFADYRSRLDIKDVLTDAGYTFYKRDGLRYPAYVRLDSDGRRISGDKYIVMPGRNCCFQPPVMKTYSPTSFIWEHPELFPEYKQGMKESAIVHKVCQRLLNIHTEDKKRTIHNPINDGKPFDISQYKLDHFNPDDFESQKPFYAFFKSRGIDHATRLAFHDSFVLASRTSNDGKVYKNLSFPMYIPGQPDKCVGFEERGYPHKDGISRKGMAAGTNASEGVWMASPRHTTLQEARNIYVFESAYDAMSFYQLQMRKGSSLDNEGRNALKAAVYVSTGGNPSYGQMSGLMKEASQATFHLGFDNDLAGKQFVANFEDIARKMSPLSPDNVPSDMKEFIESYNKPIETTSRLMGIGDTQWSCLPEELKKLYLTYDTAKEQAMEYHYSPFICKEDKQDAADQMKAAYKDFKTALLQKLGIEDGQEFNVIKIVRNTPTEGYKDFNDELLDKKQYVLTDIVETALDEDGTDLTEVREEESEETKHHGFKR